MAGFTDVNQRDFRGVNDDGSESGSTFIAALNTNWTQAQNANFGIIFALAKVAGVTWNTTNFVKFQYNINGAGWNDITSSSLVVRLSTSSNYADEAATTQRLSSPDTFNAGNILTSSTNTSTAIGNTGATQEVRLNAQIRSADTAVSDSIQVRVVNSAGVVCATYTNTPTLTVAAAASTPFKGFGPFFM